MTKKAEAQILLIFLVFIWGFSWPITAIGIHYCPAIWYAALRLAIGTVVLIGISILFKSFKLPSKKDWPFILSIGFFQIGFFFMLITLGLSYVHPGRSSLILYTYPFIAIGIAMIFFHLRLKPLQILGLLSGIIGFILLFSPWELDWHSRNNLIGNGIILLAACVWAGSVIHIRYGTWHSPPHVLLPWQFMIASIFVTVVAIISDPLPTIHWNSWIFFSSLLYSSIPSGVLATWLMIFVSRELPVSTSTITQHAIPVVALIASSFMVGETLTFGILIAMSFILAGIVLISLIK